MLHRFMLHHGATSEQDPVYEHVMSRFSNHISLRKGISAESELQCSHSKRACSATLQMEHVRLHMVTLHSGWFLLYCSLGASVSSQQHHWACSLNRGYHNVRASQPAFAGISQTVCTTHTPAHIALHTGLYSDGCNASYLLTAGQGCFP